MIMDATDCTLAREVLDVYRERELSTPSGNERRLDSWIVRAFGRNLV